MMRLLAALLLSAWFSYAAAQSIPFPGPGGGAGIGAPISLGTRSISGITSSCNITTTAAIVAGDLVFVFVQVASSPLRTVSSVGDGTNTYSLGKAINDGVTYSNEIWYKSNAAAVSSSATITVTLSGATNNNGCAAEAGRIVGTAATTPLDQTASQSATTASPSVTTAVLAQAAEIAIASTYQASGTNTFTEASGFSTFTNAFAVGNNNGRVSVSYRLTGATTAVTYAPTWSGSTGTLTAIATFKGGP